MTILAIDFETANNNPVSACAIGYCLYEGGRIVEENEILIRPPRYYTQITQRHFLIHGITRDMIKDAPQWPEVYEKLKERFKDSVVIAHNAAFDMRVLRSVSEIYDLEVPAFVYFDSVKLSRQMNTQLPNHRLNTICEYLGMELDHHHALSDARGCLAIVLDAMKKTGTDDIMKLTDELGIRRIPF